MGQERNDPITNTLSAQADRVSFPAFAAQMPNAIKTHGKDVAAYGNIKHHIDRINMRDLYHCSNRYVLVT